MDRASERNSVVVGSNPTQVIFSIATLKNPSMVNTICIKSFRYIHLITLTNFRLKQTWQLTKVITEMKSDTKQTMKLE